MEIAMSDLVSTLHHSINHLGFLVLFAAAAVSHSVYTSGIFAHVSEPISKLARTIFIKHKDFWFTLHMTFIKIQLNKNMITRLLFYFKNYQNSQYINMNFETHFVFWTLRIEVHSFNLLVWTLFFHAQNPGMYLHFI